jgi:hypothetical protein
VSDPFSHEAERLSRVRAALQGSLPRGVDGVAIGCLGTTAGYFRGRIVVIVWEERVHGGSGGGGGSEVAKS